MIRDLSETLGKVLKDPAQMAAFPELSGADIVFDRPTDPFAPAKSTVDLFLYDLRENVELRRNEPLVETRNGKAITTPAPFRLSCSYLVTAWPVGGIELGLQEHRLLVQILRVLSRYPTIPAGFLVGSLKGQEPPLPMVALHPDALKNISEFWTSIGNKLRPSLTVTVTISVPVFEDVADFLVTTHSTAVIPPGAPGLPEMLLQVGGRVLDPLGKGIAGAQVDVLEAGVRDFSDDEGRFLLLAVPSGAHTIRAVASGFVPKTQPITVPGRPEDYEITLVPL
jgi:hypothetical protein